MVVVPNVFAPVNVCATLKWDVSESKKALSKTPVMSVVKSIAFLVISCPDIVM